MLSDLRLYFVSVLQNISVSISVSLNEIIYISVSISVSVNEYNTAYDDFMILSWLLFLFTIITLNSYDDLTTKLRQICDDL